MAEQDKALIKKSEEHLRLVKRLKQALMVSQVGFFEAGKYLYEIYTKKTYEAEDSNEKWTFTRFCQRPDIPLPGITNDSRLRIAQKLIRDYQFYVLEKGLSKEKLAPIGYSKLDMLVPVIKKFPDEMEEWLLKATALTLIDLAHEIRHKDQSLGELLECVHPQIEKTIRWRCTKCGQTWNRNPKEK